MRTRFITYDEYIDIKNIQDYGFILDDQEYYKEFDREILLKTGDHIQINGAGFCKIVFKIYDVDLDIMKYDFEQV